jgi:ABC-type ATPase with predicted acetyltransferase domain
MPRGVRRELPLWRCPVCGDEVRAMARDVGHKCPVRKRQPTAEKGKRKLSEWVDFERVEPDV